MQPSVLPSLTPQETSILVALCDGLTNEEIASLHDLNITTVRSAVRVIATKLHARSRADLMRAASALIQRVALEIVAAREESAPTGMRRLARDSGEIDAVTTRNGGRRFWVTASLAFVSGVLSVITSFWPDWIERGFGLDPDHANGFVELAMVICFITTTAILSFAAGQEWQRMIPHSSQS